MKEITCCFTGHREIPYGDLRKINKQTKLEIKRLIQNGVTVFICGGAVGFDMLCGQIISKLKAKNKNIKLLLAIPCKDQDKYFSKDEKHEYKILLSNADEIIYTSESYFNGCMHKRNRYMVDNSKYIISYCTKNNGGSYYTREYAKSKNLTIINIAT